LKFTIRKDALDGALQTVFKAVSTRTTIPILSGIKIDAGASGIVLTGSDTDITIQYFIPPEDKEGTVASVDAPGSVVLPAKFFVDVVRKLPSDTVELEREGNFQTRIRSGSSEIMLVGLDPDEYPALPALEEERVFSINALLLKSMIRQTVFAVSTNESTPILTGVLWTLKNGRLKFTATDRHRLSSAEAAVEASADLSIDQLVVSGKTLGELSKIIPDDGMTAGIVASESLILFKLDNVLFYSRILDGTYPDTSKIIPQTYKTEFVAGTREFTDAIERAYLLSREEKTNIVRLVTLGSNQIEISSSLSELGKVTERLETKRLEGEELKIAFNSRYMLDALKVIDSENIQIGFTGMMSPIIVRPEGEDRMLHLILPYRTSN